MYYNIERTKKVMKHLVFARKNDKYYEVRIYKTEDGYDWVKYGDLFLNDVGVWGLWTGAGYSSEGSGLENSGDEYVEYTCSLDETFDIMELELSDILQN